MMMMILGLTVGQPMRVICVKMVYQLDLVLEGNTARTFVLEHIKLTVHTQFKNCSYCFSSRTVLLLRTKFCRIYYIGALHDRDAH